MLFCLQKGLVVCNVTVITNGDLDFETSISHEGVLKVLQDNHVLKRTQFKVEVLDVNEAPTVSLQY